MTIPRGTSLSLIEHYALYLLGMVRSDYTYNMIDPSKPLALGVGQFQGIDAHTILTMIDDDIDETLPTEIQLELTTQPIGWWDIRFPDKDEANELIAQFSTSNIGELQHDFWKWKAEFYTPLLESCGFDSTEHPREYIFALILLQINPHAGCEVFRNAAGTSELEKLFTASINNEQFYLLWERIEFAYLILNSWNASSTPPNPTNIYPLLDEGGD